MKETTKSHFITLGINLITVLPIIYAAAVYVFQPHMGAFIKDIVRHESYALKYEWVSESLTTFRNIPDHYRTQFHESEIKRLEEKQKLYRAKLSVNYAASLGDINE
jgi:hypothetical protein